MQMLFCCKSLLAILVAKQHTDIDIVKAWTDNFYPEFDKSSKMIGQSFHSEFINSDGKTIVVTML
jgi:hypothetical protein